MRSGQSFDRFAADYDRFASLESATLRNWLIGQLPAHGQRALDVGCGSGRNTRTLGKRFDDVVGVDISAPLIDIARHRASRNVRYAVGDLMTFGEATGFDLVFSSTTLHHVSDLDAALLHLRDLVKPGGIAILIDNIASRPTPPRWVHVLGAVRNVPSDVARVGARLASDRYLSRQEFERRYGSIFPGARFQDLGYAQGLVWAKKNPAPATRGLEVRRKP